ncbi:MAG: efflux RND transporter permease subunit, partial [Planctomycetota bacterium]
MLNAVIRFALRQRLLVAALALFVLLYGGWQTLKLPIDVFPNLDRPRVTVMVEAPGLAPEEVEALITFPLESTLNGATGVQAVRTQSGVGIAVIYVEFDWGTDIYVDRQVVTERLALVADHLPPGIAPQLAPISSVMGQIMIIGMWSEGGQTAPMELRTLADWEVRQRLLTIPGVSQVFVMGGDRMQFQVLVSPDELLRYGVTLHEVKTALEESNANATGGYLDQQGPNELLVRSLGRIRTTDEIRDVVVKMRGDRPVTVGQVAKVIEGPQVKRGDSAAFVRVESRESRVGGGERSSSALDSGLSTLDSPLSTLNFSGGPAVVLTINKQPHADTRQVTNEITAALGELEDRLPGDVRIYPQLYQQKAFIDVAIDNVWEALLDGGLLVVVILFLFLLNFRTTFITLTAIPLSIVVTGLVFKWFDLSINTMTLGGLAVAIGELVDDAIVGVENVFRRLRENRLRGDPESALLVVFRASAEVRNPIVFGTVIVVLVFIPVFALSGMEGRLFTPLGIAYIVSILSSLLVSLTLTPLLSYWLLARKGIWPWVAAVLAPLGTFAISYWVAPELLALLRLDRAAEWLAEAPLRFHLLLAGVASPLLWAVIMLAERFSHEERDGLLLRVLKGTAAVGIRIGLAAPVPVLLVSLAVVAASGYALVQLENDFLPPFNEGAVQLNIILPPGTSLKTSSEVSRKVEQRLKRIEDLTAFVRKSGRAELDEHAVTVNFSEIIASFDPNTTRSREEILEDLREAMADVPGIVTAVDQPLQHLISHTLSGVKAQVAIKLFGNDL